MKKETLYLIEDDKLIEVKVNEEVIHASKSEKLFNDECLKELTTYKGRLDAIRSIFSYRYNTPLYLNDEVLLFKLKTDKVYWINYYNVINIRKDSIFVLIDFLNDITLKVKTNYRTCINSYKKAEAIANYKNDFI